MALPWSSSLMPPWLRPVFASTWARPRELGTPNSDMTTGTLWCATRVSRYAR